MRIGIITEYYNNRNYGGLLQAYALTNILIKMGAEAEQISFNRRLKPEISSKTEQIKKLLSKGGIKKAYRKVRCDAEKKRIASRLIERNTAFQQFQDKIPHTAKVYDSSTIGEISNSYDGFVCGSDQVWQMQNVCSAYFLEFVDDSIPKFSYSASMPDVKMDKSQKAYVIEQLNRFNRISVREKITATVLNPLLSKEVKWTLDPTLLLSKEEWIKCSDDSILKKIGDKKYILCYFLGENLKAKKKVKEFSIKKGYTLVNLPHFVCMKYGDINFGDIDLYNVTPEMFLSLIRNAEYVMTDSFHACVFSNTFETNYFVFNRSTKINMRPRIENILELFDCQWRFIEPDDLTVENIDINSFPVRATNQAKMKESSLEYLQSIIDDVLMKN